jgi:hypothetical protein
MKDGAADQPAENQEDRPSKGQWMTQYPCHRSGKVRKDLACVHHTFLSSPGKEF